MGSASFNTEIQITGKIDDIVSICKLFEDWKKNNNYYYDEVELKIKQANGKFESMDFKSSDQLIYERKDNAEAIIEASGPYGRYRHLGKTDDIYKDIAKTFPNIYFNAYISGWTSDTKDDLKCEFKEGLLYIEFSFGSSDDETEFEHKKYKEYFYEKISEEELARFFEISIDDCKKIQNDLLYCVMEEDHLNDYVDFQIDSDKEKSFYDLLKNKEIETYEVMSEKFRDEYWINGLYTEKKIYNPKTDELTWIKGKPATDIDEKNDNSKLKGKQKNDNYDINKVLSDNGIDNCFKLVWEKGKAEVDSIDKIKIGDECVLIRESTDDKVLLLCSRFGAVGCLEEDDCKKLMPLLDEELITNMVVINSIEPVLDILKNINKAVITFSIRTDFGNKQYF